MEPLNLIDLDKSELLQGKKIWMLIVIIINVNLTNFQSVMSVSLYFIYSRLRVGGRVKRFKNMINHLTLCIIMEDCCIVHDMI